MRNLLMKMAVLGIAAAVSTATPKTQAVEPVKTVQAPNKQLVPTKILASDTLSEAEATQHSEITAGCGDPDCEHQFQVQSYHRSCEHTSYLYKVCRNCGEERYKTYLPEGHIIKGFADIDPAVVMNLKTVYGDSWADAAYAECLCCGHTIAWRNMEASQLRGSECVDLGVCNSPDMVWVASLKLVTENRSHAIA